ncbi:ATPase family AAA domain-containing protein 1-B [Plectosphaerella plurivora]|uniref:ATPase family AAA domain-containing protein 1-B n=1 Tax=Plectosphaerella plurivora TaxID=936078 RepID=A0A9P8V7R5_9PEZI|nr:ATPase family AAA domain-containing protein 1-B [Plectosphaerella plurivora]
MHSSRPRALPSLSAGALASTRFSPSNRRYFQTSLQLCNNPADAAPASDGGKPPGKPEAEQQGTASKSDGDKTVEASTRRAKNSAFVSSRIRPTRSRPPSSDLPPVHIPKVFLKGNILTHEPTKRLKILADDPIWHEGYVGALWQEWLWRDLEVVLDAASWNPETVRQALEDLPLGNTEASLRRTEILGETARWLRRCLRDKWAFTEDKPPPASDARGDLSLAFLDAKKDSPVVSAILSSDRRADPSKGTKESAIAPDDQFLRTHIEETIRQPASDNTSLGDVFARRTTYTAGSWTLEYHGSRIFDSKLLGELTTAVRAEFSLTAEEGPSRRELKRPLIVAHIPNYNGTYATRKLGARVASQLEADLLRVDAHDLATIVGGYLGQDPAYSRGPISMLAYRTAEMSGRLTKGVESPDAGEEDLSGDIDAAWVTLRQNAPNSSYKTPVEEELQRIKGSAKDYLLPSVDKWENLKINAALEQIVQAAVNKTDDPTRPLIIQIDNFIELNMTLEGALLIGRLRALVDEMWQGGKKIVLLGTSAVRDPSDQFVSTMGDIASEECLIRLPLQLHKITGEQSKRARRESTDFLQENLRNLHTMSRALSSRGNPDTSFVSELACWGSMTPGLVDSLDGVSHYRSVPVRGLVPELFPQTVTAAVLPCADVYHAARLLHVSSPINPMKEQVTSRRVVNYFIDVFGSKTLTSGTDQSETRGGKAATDESQASTKSNAEPERMAAGGKYNDFEKKLLTGLIDVKEIRTTFADVHAPADTIAALKLLTSLSLRRPEAFTYGILANDRIPGCLLYGPPGTGKTLLAKAVAKESGANMLEVSGASINDMYVGQSEKNVRALFSLAKKLSPLVIFIDEADALFAARGQSRSRPSHRETINQFLREWDGMSNTKAFIMVATNRPFDLDDAVLRRLPRKILVDLPLQADRTAILKIMLKDERLDDSVSIDAIARSAVLYSGSDLKNLCVAAAMAAVQEEVEDASKHVGPEPYVFPERRTLHKRHFDKAAGEIAASISEDMDSLKAIRKFDQKYGDQRSRQKKHKTLGFGVVQAPQDAEDARVRQPVPA